MYKVGLITAGLGSSNHVLAGRRVVKAAREFGNLTFIRSYEESDLEECAPNVFKKYKGILNPETKGYGYFAWKPELILSAFNISNLDLVVWVDAGCELNTNRIAQAIFNFQLRRAVANGYYFYDLDYREDQYTKRDVLAKFPSVRSNTRQVQATHFMVARSHLGIIQKWRDYVLESLHNIDLNPSLEPELDVFIEHRFDQSLLSLIVKSEGLAVSKLRPSGQINSFRSLLHGVLSPVWTIRNRTGNSLIKEHIQSFVSKKSR
jgi:hypothetical protein